MNLFPPTDNTLLYFLRHTLDVVQVTFSLGITPGAATQVQQPLHFLRGREKLTCTNPSTESAPQCCPPTRGAIGPASPCPPSTAVAAAATSGGVQALASYFYFTFLVTQKQKAREEVKDTPI